MHLEDYISGQHVQQYQYKSFSPTTINHEWTWNDPQINLLLEQSTRALAELNAFSLIVPDIDLFIQMHVVKEANTSSRIEGTQTQMDEAIKDEDDIDPEKRDDWNEVRNYISAMNDAIEELRDLPLSSRLLRKTHETLIAGVRGEKKTPGDFRRSQNWIGGSNLRDAVFIPPHHNEISGLISDLEKFWHNEEIDVPDLIKIAISHYQFETIHPFLDGNGRIGRLLITLYFISKGLLMKPSLYVSDYLEKHKGSYYDALTTVRSSNNLIHWIKFFLVAVKETAEKGKATFQEIMALRREVDAFVTNLGSRAPRARILFNHLYKRPIINANDTAELLGVSHQTASSLIRDLESKGFLTETTGYQRNRAFMFYRYFKLFMD